MEYRRPLVVINGRIQELPITDTIVEGDIQVYSKRIDFISDNELYRGEAAVGSSESDPVWRIRKITISPTSDITEIWAEGVSSFSKIWNNRLVYNYS